MPGFVVASARGIGTAAGGGGGGFGRGGGGGGRGGLRSNLSDGFDPYAFSVSLALASGITSAFLSPGFAGSGIFEDPVDGNSAGIGGTATVMKPTEGDLASMTLMEPAAVILDYAASSPSGKYDVRDRLRQAKEYAEKRAAYEKEKLAGKDVKEPPKDEEKEILAKLVNGEIPARITATTVENILAAVELAREFSMRVVIEAATEAWIVADDLGKGGVACVITPRRKAQRDRTKTGPSGSSDELAAILRRAGVAFAVVPPTNSVGTGGIAGRDLVTFPIEAAFAMRGGLDEGAALESITIGAARILGVADRVGSLEVGKDADVIVLDGNPLDYKTFVEKTFINGKLYYDKDKSTFFSHLKRQ
jgi:imidazolonepropionase-like amidohydrolase